MLCTRLWFFQAHRAWSSCAKAKRAKEWSNKRHKKVKKEYCTLRLLDAVKKNIECASSHNYMYICARRTIVCEFAGAAASFYKPNAPPSSQATNTHTSNEPECRSEWMAQSGEERILFSLFFFVVIEMNANVCMSSSMSSMSSVLSSYSLTSFKCNRQQIRHQQSWRK